MPSGENLEDAFRITGPLMTRSFSTQQALVEWVQGQAEHRLQGFLVILSVLIYNHYPSFLVTKGIAANGAVGREPNVAPGLITNGAEGTPVRT